VGLVVSVFQAVTQIQEFTLTFVPKIIGVIAVFVVAMPWMLNVLLSFVTNLLSSFQAYTR
jgi:flagellar biosynthetic protein FliQ